MTLTNTAALPTPKCSLPLYLKFSVLYTQFQFPKGLLQGMIWVTLQRLQLAQIIGYYLLQNQRVQKFSRIEHKIVRQVLEEKVKFKRCSLCYRGAGMRCRGGIRIQRLQEDQKKSYRKTNSWHPSQFCTPNKFFNLVFLNGSNQAKGTQGSDKHFETFFKKANHCTDYPCFLDSIAVFSFTARPLVQLLLCQSWLLTWQPIY